MNTGKTNLKLKLNGNANLANNIVQDWLKTYGFAFTNMYNENMYYNYDNIRGFQYRIADDVLDIYAWTVGADGQFYSLDLEAEQNAADADYKRIIDGLFNQVNLHCNSANVANQNYTRNTGSETGVGQDNLSSNNVFKKDADTKKEKMCIAGFVLSIVGLILPFVGGVVGLLGYMLIFYLASQGLKTSKKKLAIASIVIASVAVAITIISLVINVLGIGRQYKHLNDYTTESYNQENDSEKYIDFDNMCFYINGKKYVLGKTTLQEMIDDGVPFQKEIYADADTLLRAQSFSDEIYIELQDEEGECYIAVSNFTDKDKKISECCISDMSYLPEDSSSKSDFISFNFPKNINIDDFIAKAGEPNNREEYEGNVEGRLYTGTLIEYTRMSELYNAKNGYLLSFDNDEFYAIGMTYMP